MWHMGNKRPRDKSKANDRDVGKQMKKDAWLLKGIVQMVALVIHHPCHVRFLK